MATALSVNGVATIKTGTGASQALELLGYGGPEGVHPEVRTYSDGVFTDAWGPHVPEDEQNFLRDALVRVRLINYDEAVLAKIRNRMGTAADDATQNDMAATGALWGAAAAGAGYFRLLIESPVAGKPVNFLAARIQEWPFNMGTKVTEYNLVFYCRPVIVSTVKVLYNRVTT